MDYIQFVSNPCTRARYEILRSSLNEMLRRGLIHRAVTPESTWIYIPNDKTETPDLQTDAPDAMALGLAGQPPLKDSDDAFSMFKSEPDEDESKLWVIAEKYEVNCDKDGFSFELIVEKGISGRRLKRLPLMAIAMHLQTKTCSMSEALGALIVEMGKE